MSKKVMVVAFLKPAPHKFEFIKWPNHLTIVPYFTTKKINELIDEIEAVCSNIRQVSYEVGEIDRFGENENFKVSRIKNSKALTKLHTNVLKIALTHDNGIDTTFCYPNYAPHITHDNKPYPKEKDVGNIKSIGIIEDLSVNTKNKRVLSIIDLTG